jgi:hypothetical protein
LWGAYHGLLLVAHRQIQQTQRRWNWQPPAAPWTTLSWIVTITCVSLGWILFRANSPAQARQMLSTVLSPAGYFAHTLSGSLYWLVAGLALSYAMALFVVDVLNRNTLEADPSSDNRSGVAALAARWRWFWIPPLYAVTLLFVLMVTLTRGTDTAQFMYGNF